MSDTSPMTADQSPVHEKIARHRSEIDAYDSMIIQFFALRSDSVNAIGELKRAANLPVHDPIRESSQFARYASLARRHNMPPEQVIAPFRTIIFLSKQAQQEKAHLTDTSPIVPKLCLSCRWTTCGIEVPESFTRVCPTCRSPLF